VGTAASNAARYCDRLNTVYKKIKLRRQHLKEAAKISCTHKLTAVAGRILAARGFKAGYALENFLNPTLKQGLPLPADLLNLEAACELIKDSIRLGKGIAICCDFDVDGLSGGSQIHHFLKALGAESRVFIPDRFEDGYGLNRKMVQEIARRKFGLLVTVDYGTTNAEELELARGLGLKTVVIDHHHVADAILPCDAFINPWQRGCGFAGKVLSASGLAWYLICGLKKALAKIAPTAIDPRTYLDLACLGTICDMVPLTGANRVIARRGLELLSATKRPGLIALKNVAGIQYEPSCYDVSFAIGPRLNAAGRMVHADAVIELLTTDDSLLADKIARRLNRLNSERQETESRTKEQALKILQRDYPRGDLPPGLVIWDKSFHSGVIGIVAQRLVELFYRPVALMGMGNDGLYRGSVRGVKGFSVVEALAAVSATLVKFGGHEGAGGFAVRQEKARDFAEAFMLECEKRLKGLDTIPCAEADTEVSLPEVDMALVDELRLFSPFGVGNPSPQLLVNNLKVIDVKNLKGTHLKALLSDGTRFISGLLWRQTEHPALRKGARVNVVFKADYNTFGGITELQANLQAIEEA